MTPDAGGTSLLWRVCAREVASESIPHAATAVPCRRSPVGSVRVSPGDRSDADRAAPPRSFAPSTRIVTLLSTGASRSPGSPAARLSIKNGKTKTVQSGSNRWTTDSTLVGLPSCPGIGVQRSSLALRPARSMSRLTRFSYAIVLQSMSSMNRSGCVRWSDRCRAGCAPAETDTFARRIWTSG